MLAGQQHIHLNQGFFRSIPGSLQIAYCVSNNNYYYSSVLLSNNYYYQPPSCFAEHLRTVLGLYKSQQGRGYYLHLTGEEIKPQSHQISKVDETLEILSYPAFSFYQKKKKKAGGLADRQSPRE